MYREIMPPHKLGILGGGQLGRMFTIAAKTMGYAVVVLDPDPNAPAAHYADEHICSSFKNAHVLADCLAITTEFENVDANLMQILADKTQVSPSGQCVAIAQNRILEKSWIVDAGLKTAPYQIIQKIADISEASKQYLPGILKTVTLGYDGKGQTQVKSLEELRLAFESHHGVPCVLEKMLNLRAEVSVIVCRLDNEHIVTYDPAENQHENGILAYSIVPARLPETILQQAQNMAIQLANQLNYVGVLAVEMFVVGDNYELIINEIAPRPHNSGHHTIDACVTSQFEQQVRIMCGLPPADTTLLSPCCMANILGDVWGKNGEQPNWEQILTHQSTHLHQYGKKVAKAGRKMAHFTTLAPTPDEAYLIAKQLKKTLKK